jgi:hypothetical protein
MRAKDIFIHDVLASSAGWHPQLSNSSPKPSIVFSSDPFLFSFGASLFL